MTRKDITIIAVLGNIAALAILFMLAYRAEEDQHAGLNDAVYTITDMVSPPSSSKSSNDFEIVKLEPEDEVDALLEEVTPIGLAHSDGVGEEAIHYIDTDPTPSGIAQIDHMPPGRHEEVIVKNGDALAKIARNYGTTVDRIMAFNRLSTDKLKIGQVIRIPVAINDKPPEVPTSNNGTYYTMQKGDSLWKVAKKFNNDVEGLLKLNHLDENGARKLKDGARIRVR